MAKLTKQLVSDERIIQVYRQYKKCNTEIESEMLETVLIKYFMPTVEYYADYCGKVSGVAERVLERDDFIMAGQMGVVEGVREYNETCDVPFPKFVCCKIKSAILSETKKFDCEHDVCLTKKDISAYSLY